MTETVVRTSTFDRVRGAAIALMVLDHALVQAAPTSILRYTVTRWSLPLFMIVAGALAYSFTFRRARSLWLLAIPEAVLYALLPGMGVPGILAVLALVTSALALLERIYPHWRDLSLLLVLAGFLQALYQPLGWSGYEPGLILAYVLLGHGCARQIDLLGSALPSWLAGVGLRPRLWYFAHLLVLVPLAGIIHGS